MARRFIWSSLLLLPLVLACFPHSVDAQERAKDQPEVALKTGGLNIPDAVRVLTNGRIANVEFAEAFSQNFAFGDRGGISLTTRGSAASAGVGYARIQPNSGSTTTSGIAIFGFRQNGVLVTEAGVPASPLIRAGRIYAEVNGPVNTGLAIANPNDSIANITFFFTDTAGRDLGSGNLNILPNQQIAAFLNQSPFNGPALLEGTLTFNSNVPISAITLRGFTNERSEFLITTLPIVELATTASDAVTFPHFADGGGWVTQLVLVNPTDETLNGTIEFFGQGNAISPAFPVTVIVDGESSSTFSYSVSPRSSRRFRTSGLADSARAGSIRVKPLPNNKTPSGIGIFSFRNAGVTVTEAGVPALRAATAHRMYAELSNSIQTGVAVANPLLDEVTVTFEVNTLTNPSARATGRSVVPGSGQVALFLNQIPGLQSLPSPFQGVLRISTNSPVGVSVVGLRGRNNERGDFLITTTPPVNENAVPSISEMLFPHFADGGGYTTQFILFSGTAGQTPSGVIRFFDRSGQPLNVGFQ